MQCEITVMVKISVRLTSVTVCIVAITKATNGAKRLATIIALCNGIAILYI